MRIFVLVCLGLGLGLGLVACTPKETTSADAGATAAATASVTAPASTTPPLNPTLVPPPHASMHPSTAPSASAMPAPTCKAPEVLGYIDKVKPVCAKPCKVEKDCAANQTCVMNYKTNEPTMGMSQARADEQYQCMPKAK